MTALPNMPPLPCPDCGGQMFLKRKPEHWHGKNPFSYMCERYGKGCGGLMSAHPDGRPMGVPVAKEVRQARRHCHHIFDRLWLDVKAAYPDAKTQADMNKLRGTMRRRAYQFMAEKLAMPEHEVHIAMMTDLDLLRRFYSIARGVSAAEIRAWAKSRKEAA